MEDKHSIIRALGLPDAFAVVLITFSFVMLLAPYFSGGDFGAFKIPQFTARAQRWLKFIGPIIFSLCLMLFVPLIPSKTMPTDNPGPGNRNTEEKALIPGNTVSTNNSSVSNGNAGEKTLVPSNTVPTGNPSTSNGNIQEKANQSLGDSVIEVDGIKYQLPSANISSLRPEAYERAKQLVDTARQLGIDVVVTKTWMGTGDEAVDMKYSQKTIRTDYAERGEFVHHTRLAFDIVPIVNGKPLHFDPHVNRLSPEEETKFDKLGEIGESLGLLWGGRRFNDKRHFEYVPNK